MDKISIRFFDNREVRALWDEANHKWWFSVLDIVAVLTDQDEYLKVRNYWKYLKAKLKKENSQVVSKTTQLKLLASDGKRYLSVALPLQEHKNSSFGWVLCFWWLPEWDSNLRPEYSG